MKTVHVPFTKYEQRDRSKPYTEGEPDEREQAFLECKRAEPLWFDGVAIVKALLKKSKTDRYALSYVRGIAQAALYGLQELSEDGNEDAQRNFLISVYEPLAQMFRLAEEQPDILRNQARKSAGWPLVYSPHPEYQKRHQEVMKRLEVGRDAVLKVTTPPAMGKRNRRWTLESAATRYAYQALQVVNTNNAYSASISMDAEVQGITLPQWVKDAAKLPPLKKRTAKKWFAVCKQAILEAYPAIETEPEWKNVSSHSNRETPARVRAKILSMIEQSFLGLVNQ